MNGYRSSHSHSQSQSYGEEAMHQTAMQQQMRATRPDRTRERDREFNYDAAYEDDEYSATRRATPSARRAAAASAAPAVAGTAAAPSSSRRAATPSNALAPPSSSRASRANTASESAAHKNFKVVIRIRPPLPRELDAMRGPDGRSLYRDIVRTDDNNRAVSICESGVSSRDFGMYTVNGDGSSNSSDAQSSGGIYATHRFTFDYVYDQDARQVDVYNNTAREAVMSTLQGYSQREKDTRGRRSSAAAPK